MFFLSDKIKINILQKSEEKNPNNFPHKQFQWLNFQLSLSVPALEAIAIWHQAQCNIALQAVDRSLDFLVLHFAHNKNSFYSCSIISKIIREACLGDALDELADCCWLWGIFYNFRNKLFSEHVLGQRGLVLSFWQCTVKNKAVYNNDVTHQKGQHRPCIYFTWAQLLEKGCALFSRHHQHSWYVCLLCHYRMLCELLNTLSLI